MDYSDGEVALPECHRVKRKDMKLFFFLDVFIAGLRSATVVFAPISYSSAQNPPTLSRFTKGAAKAAVHLNLSTMV
jgi:hypothetical protein